MQPQPQPHKNRTISKSRSRSRSRSQEKHNNQVLIDCLKEDQNYLLQKYNQNQESKEIEIQKKQKEMISNSRAGGVYIPPHKLRSLQKELLDKPDESQEHQKMCWELLRKSINGIINKVNVHNIQNVIIELLNENLLKGKGLLARAIIKAQMGSPNFTHIYCGLLSVINTKLPEIVNLVIKRVVVQFQRSYKRNNKIMCMATTKMLAHLINQQIVNDYLGLQLLTLLLEVPSEDSVEIAVEFVKECGQVMNELTPEGVNAIFERFKGILHEGQIDKRVQYSIENLFAIRKNNFENYQGVMEELDLVDEEDKITHNIGLDDEIDPEDKINIFKYDPFFKQTEQEWEAIKKEILGEENIIKLKTKINEHSEVEQEEPKEQINDLTEKEIVNLRRTIYLVIMNSIDYQECMHKLLKMNIGEGCELEVCNMLIECAAQERTYLRFYGLLAQRFCEMFEVYKLQFMSIFDTKYKTIHRYETNKLRNMAKFYAHLLYNDSIDWSVFNIVKITQDSTTSSSRIFIKIVLQDLAENMGLQVLNDRLKDNKLFTAGMFPLDHPRNTRFSINFFTSIGLGALTDEMRNYLDAQNQNLQQMIERQNQMQLQLRNDSSSSDSDSDSSSDSSSSNSNSSSSDSSSQSD